ncbi:MAG: hypothetical protein EXQ47_09565 [Bryobacterales bacterium]|nr:hypothetical protein [Bryobacterales bacterium]
MQRLLGFVVLIVFAAQAVAQVGRPQPPAAQVEQSEATLKTNPNDSAARGALLNYYFRNSALNPAEAVPARRRHILWLIQNAPASELAGLPAATIDAVGHRLADPQGFKLASDAWRSQTAKPDTSAMVLANAARFFKLSDKEFTMSLLDRAHTLELDNKEISARLGDEYALAIMGATMVNQNGYPLAADPRLIQSAAAQQAREALTTSRNPYALAKAGYMLSWQGAVLYYSRKLAFDPSPLAESALLRAVSLAPGDREIAALMNEFREIQRQKAAAGVPPGVSPGAAPPPPATPGAPVRATAIPAPPAGPQVTADDLKKIAVGMKREELLKLGQPAGRVVMSDGGHLSETYQYSVAGQHLGRVRLTDGIVSSVEIP